MLARRPSGRNCPVDCAMMRSMQLASKKAVVRILVVLGLLAAGTWYMCYCPRAGKRVITPPNISAVALRAHVTTLAGEIGERNTEYPDRLHAAANYIAQVWSNQGYTVARQLYKADGVECCNLEIQIPGSATSAPIVLVGAHYDSVAGSPGANDNASGVASLLELSRACKNFRPKNSLRFVAFVNEEPPYFQTALQGSAVYARAARQRGDDIRAMIALETMGYFSDEPGSQHFPMKLFNLVYPSRGNFISFISNFSSRSRMHEAVRSFRAHTTFPVECCATFSKIPGVDWSDHAPFWKEGYRAFMVTDTAPFRYPYYHSENDTLDKVDYEALARVTQGLTGVLATLSKTN
jgi:hypothetical protein